MNFRRCVAVPAILSASLAAANVATACTLPDHDALVVLDASYSMLKAVAPGISRFTAARQAVQALVDIFPDDGLIALRFYGSQSQAVKMDCRDTVLAVPFAPASTNRDNIRLALSMAHARGYTPIAYSLQQALGDFPEEAIDRTIILVSDGGESCDGDPCATAATLSQQGFVINTVGLMVNGIARAELRCIAAAAGGQYFDVPVALKLTDALKQAVGECPVATVPARRADDEAMPS